MRERDVARLFCLILLGLFQCSALAAESAYRYNSAIWIDRSGEATLQSASSQHFTPIEGPLRLGFVKEPVWVRVTIEPKSRSSPGNPVRVPDLHSAVIRVVPFPIDRIELYSGMGELELVQVAGDLQPRQSRTLCPDDAHCLFIDHPSSGRFDIYLRISTRGILHADIAVLSPEEVPQIAARRIAITSVSVVSALAFLCVGLVILIFEYRSRLLMAYCLFQCVILVFMLIRAGLLVDLITGLSLESVDIASHFSYALRVAATGLLCWSVVDSYRPAATYQFLCIALMLAVAGAAIAIGFGAISAGLQIAFLSFWANGFVHFYGVLSSRAIGWYPRGFLLLGFSVYAMVASIGMLLAYGVLGSSQFQSFPAHFGDLRLNGTPISIVFFIVVLLERATIKVRQLRELDRLRDGAAQAKAVAEQSRDRQAFIDMLAHELKNPLASIQFAIKSLQRALLAGSDPGRHLHSVETSARRIGDFVEHVTTLSRVEAMDAITSATRMSAADMVQEVVLEYPDPDRFRVEVGHAATFSADRQLLTIMIDNLVSNARKYSTPGSLISIVINSRDGRTRLSISNDVPPGCLPDQAKLFERFYRHPGVMGIPGSGLGLAVARLSAEKLAAHIESRIEGNQVSFIVDIPA